MPSQREIDMIRWTRIDHEEDGYDEEDTIKWFAKVGPWYLRVNELDDGFTWVILKDYEVVRESGASPTYRTADDAQAACERAFANL